MIFLLQENHSFDSLFGGFPGADGVNAGQACPDALPADPPHQHADAIQRNSATSDAARCSYTPESASTYWKLASEFTLCDKYFSDVRGPSHPNYLMLVAGQSPILDTPMPNDTCPDFCLDIPTLANRLDDKSLTWRDYGGILTDIKSLAGRSEITDGNDTGFFDDAAAGTLPNVGWINSSFLTDGDMLSGHPPSSLCSAEQYVVRVINALYRAPSGNPRSSSCFGTTGAASTITWRRRSSRRWTTAAPLRLSRACVAISPTRAASYHKLACQSAPLRRNPVWPRAAHRPGRQRQRYDGLLRFRPGAFPARPIALSRLRLGAPPFSDWARGPGFASASSAVASRGSPWSTTTGTQL